MKMNVYLRWNDTDKRNPVPASITLLKISHRLSW